MRSSHPAYATDTAFDEDNLLPDAGLVPLLALAERAGLTQLLTQRLTVAGGRGAGADGAAKVVTLVAGMAAGADSIDDLDVLRHGAMPTVFEGVKAPSTIGTHLRAYTFGHVRQLDAVSSRFLLGLHRTTGLLTALAAPGAVTYVDIDDTMREMHGYAAQGVAYGYNKIKGLNAQLATVSTRGPRPLAPVVAATRLRRGNVASAHGAGKIVAEAVATAKAGGAHTIVARADSAYYGVELAAAARKAGAQFSVTARSNPSITRAITSIEDGSWVGIKYPQAIWDDEEARWVSDAQVAEVPYVAFTSRRKAQHVAGRLIVRRVKRLNPTTVPAGQGELFALWRYHTVFTDQTGPMLDLEAAHRDHAIIESVIADYKAGPLAHLPSGVFTANAAWLVCATICHNLLRAAAHVGDPTGGLLARARGATLRRRLVHVPARIARTGRRLRLHLPTRWRWAAPWTRLAAFVALAAAGPPGAPAP